jgi:hypothetical protein
MSDALQPSETWQAGDVIPPSLARHIRERIIVATGENPDGQVLTAAMAERWYPKAEYIRRGSCCGITPK